jgi:hypothetical protein
MDLSGRWEFSFDRNLNGQVVPTSPPYELILVALDDGALVGRFVFPGEDRSKFRGELSTTSQGTLLVLRQVNPNGYQAVYSGTVESEARVAGVFTDVGGHGDFRMKKIR